MQENIDYAGISNPLPVDLLDFIMAARKNFGPRDCLDIFDPFFSKS